MPTSCKCFARCEADCVCDYDWTPPEVTRLRHDIERHIRIASELATENERLRTTLERLREALESIAGGEIYPVQVALDALMAEVEGSK